MKNDWTSLRVDKGLETLKIQKIKQKSIVSSFSWWKPECVSHKGSKDLEESNYATREIGIKYEGDDETRSFEEETLLFKRTKKATERINETSCCRSWRKVCQWIS